MLTEVAESFLNFRVVAAREAEMRAGLCRPPRGGGRRPLPATDIHDLAGLLRLGSHLW